jgi:nucleoid DNA-binding protein
MNKGELVDAIAKEAKLSKTDAEAALDAFRTVVTKALKKGTKVSLVGFVTIERIKRPARIARSTPPQQSPTANPNSTTRATPNALCSTKRLPSTSRLGMNLPAQANSMARVTTTPQSLMSAKPFASIWSAASSPTALPALTATSVSTIS